MMIVRKWIAEIVSELDGGAAELVQARIRWETRAKPTPADLALGAKPGDRGLFVGHPVRAEEDEDQGGELYVDDEGNVEAEGEAEYYVDDAGDVEEAGADPGGRIILFLDNIRPLTRENLEPVVMHEIAHFLGEDEDGVEELGFGA